MLVPVGGGDPIPLRKAEVLVGRRRDCDIVLDFGNVSSKHCQLVLSNGYWYVLDMKSRNGIKVNGKQATDQRLDPGVTLSIAKHPFTVKYDPVANGATGPPPAQLLREDDILSRSLMERAGLQRPKFLQADEPGSTVADMPVVVTPNPAGNGVADANAGKREKKDYFSALKFD